MRQVRDEQEQMSDDAVTDPEDWVDRHGDSLYRYALLRLRSPDLAADVVQETFLDALRARSAFAGHSSERTWLIGRLRHKIVNHLRKVRREPAAGNGVSANGTSESPFGRRGHWRVGPAHWGCDPSREMETREFWEVFNGCLSRLPQGLVNAFFLRELKSLEPTSVRSPPCAHLGDLWRPFPTVFTTYRRPRHAYCRLRPKAALGAWK